MYYSLASAWEPLRGLGAVGWDQEAGLALDGLYTLLGWGLLFRPQRWRHRGDYNLVDWVPNMACDIAKAYVVRSGLTAESAAVPADSKGAWLCCLFFLRGWSMPGSSSGAES